MASFSRSGDLYGVSLITGPSSALVRLRFSDNHGSLPSVVVLGPDERYGNPTDAHVASTVADAVQQANDNCGTEFVVTEVHYKCDNDCKCALIRRAAYIIVRRRVEVADADFAGAA
ncbi:MAG: hypothetical protein ACI8P0_002583 [Planctomycetaceae bacterium]|jgi:hypothetical protein